MESYNTLCLASLVSYVYKLLPCCSINQYSIPWMQLPMYPLDPTSIGQYSHSLGGKNTESRNGKQSSLILTGCVCLLCLKHGGGCCSVTKSCLTFCNLLNYGMPGSSSYSMSWSLLRFMSIESLMLSNHLILHCPLFLLPSIFPNIRAFSNELALYISWPKCWNFSFSISPSNEYSELISFSEDWLVLSPCYPRDSQESSPTS